MAESESELALRATIDNLLEMIEKTDIPDENILKQALLLRAARLPEVPREERIFWINLPRAGIVFTKPTLNLADAFGVDWQEPNRSYHTWRYFSRRTAEVRASYEYYGGRFEGVCDWFDKTCRRDSEPTVLRVDTQYRQGLLQRLTSDQKSYWDIGYCARFQAQLEAFA